MRIGVASAGSLVMFLAMAGLRGRRWESGRYWKERRMIINESTGDEHYYRIFTLKIVFNSYYIPARRKFVPGNVVILEKERGQGLS